MKKAVLIGFGVLMFSSLYSQKTHELLGKVLDRLEDIKMVSYYSDFSTSAPGDTIPFFNDKRHVNMYIDPSDTFLGSNFSVSPAGDHDKFVFCYDGMFGVRLDWSKMTAQVDTMSNDPFRRPLAPFFIQVRTLLEYTKDHLDSVTVEHYDLQDSTKFHFYFKDKLVDFVGLKPLEFQSDGTTSKYELVVDRSFLPYRLIRRMPHQVTWETCTDIQTSQYLDFEFNAIQQIPAHFKIEGFKMGKQKAYELEGQPAPAWKLQEIQGDNIDLGELKHKVILLQFTGIGCGPCHASIPFLKQLGRDKKEADFEILSIETWSQNIAGMERYKDKNNIDYRFLVSTPQVSENYKVESVPIFFLLDKNRVINKVIVGYQKGVTDKTINDAIDRLL